MTDRPCRSRLLARLSLPAAGDPAAVLPPRDVYSFEEAGSVYVVNDTAYPLYVTFDGTSPTVGAHDLRVPALSILAWPIRCSALAVAIDHSVHDPLADEITIWISEATLSPWRGAL